MTDEVIEQQPELVDPVDTTDEQASDQVDEQEEATTSDSEDSTAEAPKKAKGVQKRIDELTRNYRETERDRDYWRQLAMQAQQKPEEPETPAQPYEGGEPRLEQFEDYDKYIVALAKHELTQETKAAKEQEQAQVERQNRDHAAAEFGKTLDPAREKYNDFDYVAFNPQVPYSDTMTDLVMTSEQGADVAYYLGKNPQEAYRIANLDDRQAAREIGRLETKLSIPQPKTETKAPNPVSTVGSKSPAGKDPGSMSTEEWMEWRNSQLRK